MFFIYSRRTKLDYSITSSRGKEHYRDYNYIVHFWVTHRSFKKETLDFVPGLRNITGCTLGWAPAARNWCRGTSWIICPLGCLNRFTPPGLLRGWRIILCLWASCVLFTGRKAGDVWCTGISSNRGPTRFSVPGDIFGGVVACGVASSETF